MEKKPLNLGMIALGKVNTLEKKFKKLVEDVEEIKKMLPVQSGEGINGISLPQERSR